MELDGTGQVCSDFRLRRTTLVLLGSRAHGELTDWEMPSVKPQENSGLWVGGLC